MFICITMMLCTILYLIAAGATHGYAKFRWPESIVQRYDRYYHVYDADEHLPNRVAATILWPLYWILVWPFTKVNEVTFSNITHRASEKIVKNKARIADLQTTKKQVEASNSELEQAELELEKEMARL